MAKRDINSISIDAASLGGRTKDYFVQRDRIDLSRGRTLRIDLSKGYGNTVLIGVNPTLSRCRGLMIVSGYGSGTANKNYVGYLNLADSHADFKVYINGSSEQSCIYIANEDSDNALHLYVNGMGWDIELKVVDSIPEDARLASLQIINKTATSQTASTLD